jgi:hypothetical protein
MGRYGSSVFWRRVRNRLKRNELSFSWVQKVQKSAQEYENKGRMVVRPARDFGND